MSRLKFYLIGETALFISCAEFLLSRGHKIQAITSNDTKIIEWAIKSKTNLISLNDSLNIEFDYLFSIANPLIIPEKIINKARKLSINYHDSILPKYAGSYATSWAIYNNEKKHGVTWHIAEKIVDTGDILVQDFCDISDNETALSLNLKCFHIAYSTFVELIDSIESNKITRTPQNIEARSFYYKNKMPNLVIDFSMEVNVIDRLCRAFDFGDSRKKLFSPQLNILGELYNISSYGVSKNNFELSQNVDIGRIIAISDYYIEIICFNGSLTVYEISDQKGQKVTVGDLIYKFGLKQGDFIESRYASDKVLLNNKTKLIDLETINKIRELNRTDTSYFDEKAAHKIFEERVIFYKDAVALTIDNNHLTYSELNIQSNRLAYYLLLNAKNMERVTIGILLDRSIEMVISMLAVVKAGASYLPIDSFYPEARIKYMLEDSSVDLVLTERKYKDQIDNKFKKIYVRELDLENYSTANPNFYNIHNLIYILYTSGSTGKPKGAQLMHYGVSNLLTWYRSEFNISNRDNILIYTSFGFDLTQKNILGGLISGSRIVLYNSKIFDSEKIIRLIHNEQVTFINTPPAAFYSIADDAKSKDLNSLRIILLGGEVIKPEKLKVFIDKFPKAEIINTYGPTECSDLALTYNIKREEIKNKNTIPLGRNVGGVNVFILDKSLNFVPYGEVGEVYIGGRGLARCYLNKPEYTAQIFIANPFSGDSDLSYKANLGTRIYKTGDLAKYLPDGNVEFLGRIDHQIKIRGYRIELGEIESVILKVPLVKEAVVNIYEGLNDKKWIVAYIVSSKKLATEIRNKCSKYLPDYMQPDAIEYIDEIPLTPNGKVNRNALPKPNLKKQDTLEEVILSGEETLVAKILSDLLGIENVLNNDNFFALGGDSIIAIKFVANVKKLGYSLTIADIYKEKTVAQIAKMLNSSIQSKNEKLYERFSLVDKRYVEKYLTNNIIDIYPASCLQQGMLIESEKDSKIYHDVFTYKISLKFNESKFKKIVEYLVSKYTTFKSSFIPNEDYTYIVLEHANLNLDKKISINFIDDLSSIINSEVDTPFDITSPGLFRFIIKIETDASFTLIASFHHALIDGWSLVNFVKEFVKIYSDNGVLALKKKYLQEEVSYAEFVSNELENINNNNLEKWRERLANYENNSNFLISSTKGKNQQHYSLSQSYNLTDLEKLLSYSEKISVTLDSIFIAAYIFSLSKVGNYQDIVIDLVANNRPEKENAEKYIGLYLNTVPLRFQVEKEFSEDISKFIQDVNNVKGEFLALKNYPYLKLKASLNYENDFSFNYVHFHVIADLINEGMIGVTDYYERTSMPCTFDVWRKVNEITLKLNININKFSENEIQKIFDYINYFLTHILNEKNHIDNSIMLSELASLTVWNYTNKTLPSDLNIISLFDEVVTKYSDKIAIKTSKISITYNKLKDEVLRLSQYIVTKINLQQSKKIGIYLDNSINSIVSIFSILKSGYSFVPIDSKQPKERAKHIILDANLKVILTDNKNIGKLSFVSKNVKIINIDDKDILTIAQSSEHNSNLDKIKIFDKSEAYTIYTSGSTGKPKGIIIEHCSLLNYILNIKGVFLNKDEIVDFSSNISFDFTLTNIICGICSGASIAIYEDKLSLIENYSLFLSKMKVTFTKLVPAYFMQLVHLLKNHSLRTIFLGGEKPQLNIDVSNTYIEHIYDEYGPTETTIGVSLRNIYDSSGNINCQNIRYSNTKLYVLDKFLNMVPIGTPGELYIGGVCLARGYQNNSALTAEKFIANPFESGRMYKTDDLVRFNLNGSLDFIARLDSQIKINGYRIDLAEIENVLKDFGDIKQVFAIAIQDNKTYIALYYFSEEAIDSELIEKFLSERLPDYMMPNFVVHINKLPLTANNKLDRNLLPNPFLIKKTNNEKPTEFESKIIKTLEDLIGSNINVSVNDDFFKIGGDSILAIKFTSRLKRLLSIDLSVKDIFKYRIIKELCSYLNDKDAKSNNAKIINDIEGYFPLLPIQEWFFSNCFRAPNYWNQSFLIKVPELKIEKLKFAVSKLFKKHDIFNIRLKNNSLQYYKKNNQIPDIKIADIRNLGVLQSLDNLMYEWQCNFDIENGPISSFGYIFGYEDGFARIFVAMHHLFIDSVSWWIILDDLYNLYHDMPLARKTSSYKAWVNHLLDYKKTINDETKYWDEIINVNQKNNFKVRKKNYKKSIIDKSLTSKLLTKSNQAYNTETKDLLIAALALSLPNITHRHINHITLEGHGREEVALKDGVSIDISNTIGWFTTLYPARLESKKTIVETIIATKDYLRRIPNSGLGYGVLYGYKDIKLPKIIFNFLGKFNSEGDKEWNISSINHEKSVSKDNDLPFTISIDVYILNEELNIIIVSGDEDITVNLSSFFKENINKIIQECLTTNPQYTASDFIKIESESDLNNLPLLSNFEEDSWFEMTEIQKSYLIGRSSNFEIGNTSNHIYKEYYYKSLDIEKLEEAINKAIYFCDALRIVYSVDNLKQKYIKYSNDFYIKLEINDFTDNNFSEEILFSVRQRLSHKLYDTSKYPLFTFEISKFRDIFVLHFSMDLIVLDAQSRQILFKIIDSIYNNKPFEHLISKVNFHSYMSYFTLLKNSNLYLSNKNYWMSILHKFSTRPEFNFLTKPSEVEVPLFNEHTLYINKEVWTKFKKKADDNKVSYSAALLAIFGSVISYYSGYKEFLITVTLFNRIPLHEDIEKILGDFTSTLLYQHADNGGRIFDTINSSHHSLWEGINHSLFSGVEVQRELLKLNSWDIKTAISPIIFTAGIGDSISNFEAEKFLEQNEQIEKRFWSGQTSQAWIDLQVVETGSKLMSKWLYVSQLFSKSQISYMNILYCKIIKFLSQNDWDKEVDFIFKPNQLEKKIIDNLNLATQEKDESTLISRFEKVLCNNLLHKNIAVVDENNEYSYEKLISDYNNLSKNLNDALKEETQTIAILSERGYNQVVSSLAVMRCSKAYLPLNADWPLQRINSILEDSGTRYLLISKKIYYEKDIEKLSKKVKILVIEEEAEKHNYSTVTDCSLPKNSDIAYVIYTSGSTGAPKGVVITHQSVINTIDAVNKRFKITEKDKIFSISEFSFDLSVYDFFGMLLVGGAIVFPTNDRAKDPNHWYQLIKKYSVTIWNSVPQLANIFISEPTSSSLRLFLLSGDKIEKDLVKEIYSKYKSTKVTALGGATEASIWSIWYEIAKELNFSVIPYGYAMPNQKIYVLNTFLQQVPVNTTAEIYIGGMGVALSYLNNKQLTRASFINHEKYGRIYKTGDYGKINEEGYIEYIGRIDSQAKLRGYRIELGEIEQLLLEQHNIMHAYVAIKIINKTKSLVAYYIADLELEKSLLLNHLKKYLPSYMIPEFFIRIYNIPLTQNGKIDKDKLPDPKIEIKKIYNPSNNTESKLLLILQDTIGLNKVKISVEEDFFKLGASSITLMKLLSKVNKEFKVNINISDIYTNQTIQKLAILVSNNNLNNKFFEDGVI